jgi:bifunctional non-homologous end joining protein LigD
LPHEHKPQDDPLARYREKRTLERTPEPAGNLATGSGRLFVVHKHAARNLHYDLRLEMDGVLRSWAVPKGPSYDMADKRLAVLVEDHPLDYGDFEGIIPTGNYGAGGVIIWDRGRWTSIGDPAEGLVKGKLLFRLDGYKLHGLWTLVKIKKGEKEWLLIKERDGYATPGGRPVPEGSVMSGRMVEDVKAGTDLETPLLAALPVKDAPARAVHAASVNLMLCETAEKPFSRPGWVFELKLDGYRVLAEKDGDTVRLRSRNGNDLTPTFPEVMRSLHSLPFSHLVVDGEIVALDDGGKPSFNRLQQRARLRRPLDIRRAEVELPVTFFAFDLLAFGPRDLRGLPLEHRKTLLAKVVPMAGPVRFLEHIEREGERLFAQVEQMGLEGLVAKRGDSPYKGGRSAAWLKIRAARTTDLVVVGFTAPKGSRTAIGALHLAQYVDGKLRYSGRVGSGLADRELAKLREELEAERRKTPPCTGVPTDAKGSTWVEPRRVVEVRFTEWTSDGLLRHPVFLRWRDDKRPEECLGQGEEVPMEPKKPRSGRTRAAAPAEPPVVTITNADKIYWPTEKYTKGDLVSYYREIAPWILPYLKDRPVVLTRYPDGIDGKSFYQKDAPPTIPDWVRTEPIWSEDSGREIHYVVCDNLETLLLLANLGSIPLHLWPSRAGSLEKPDWCVVDLDPKEAPFSDVVTIARQLHEVCERAGLPVFIKTTGKSGLHVMVPLGRQCSWEESRTLGELLARIVIHTHGDISTITRTIQARGKKVYLDYLQNRRGQLIAAPFCVRPEPGAPVSMPLEWREVNARLDPRRYTIKTALARMAKLGKDPLRPMLELAPDLPRSLNGLAAQLSGVPRPARGK